MSEVWLAETPDEGSRAFDSRAEAEQEYESVLGVRVDDLDPAGFGGPYAEDGTPAALYRCVAVRAARWKLGPSGDPDDETIAAIEEAAVRHALADVVAERERQHAQWGDAHDDDHDGDELAAAAACLLAPSDISGEACAALTGARGWASEIGRAHV